MPDAGAGAAAIEKEHKTEAARRKGETAHTKIYKKRRKKCVKLAKFNTVDYLCFSLFSFLGLLFFLFYFILFYCTPPLPFAYFSLTHLPFLAKIFILFSSSLLFVAVQHVVFVGGKDTKRRSRRSAVDEKSWAQSVRYCGWPTRSQGTQNNNKDKSPKKD